MLNYTISGLLILIGLIHVLPITGALSQSHLEKLYGINLDDPNLILLMRHRAILFGLLGALCLYAAFSPSTQWLALVAALASIVSFFYFALAAERYNAAIRRVVIADIIAAIAWLAATMLYGIRSYAG